MSLEDGIYVGLPDADYFGQDRLGSTDLGLLHKDPASWWYGSRHNPHRGERERSAEMEFGSALHALVLEGEDAYARRRVLKPDTYPDAKTGEPKKWNGNATFCKEWQAANVTPGKIVMTEEADRRLRHMAALILNHPELGPVITKGLNEVAVLFNIDGQPMRAKFDVLLPAFLMDLKSFGGDAKGRTIREQALTLVAQRDMDVQRYLYFVARSRMKALIDAGQVFGASDDQRAWLEKVAAVEAWQWCWVFYRRRDDQRPYAPVVKPILRSHFDATFESGRRKVEVALKNYATFVDRYGHDVPWAIVEPADEPVDHEFPNWIGNVNEPVSFPSEQ